MAVYKRIYNITKVMNLRQQQVIKCVKKSSIYSKTYQVVCIEFFNLMYNFQQLINKRRFFMGCSESKVQNPPKEINQNEATNNQKLVKFAQNSPKRSVEANLNEKKELKQRKSPLIGTTDENSAVNSKSKGKSDKQNVTKVKKAKELQNKPEHQKFISDIVSKSRAKLAMVIPADQVSSQGFSKPVVEYSPKKNGVIFSKEYQKDYNKSHWERAITENPSQIPNNIVLNKSYIAVNETIKSPYTQKEIQKKLNNIRNQSKNLEAGKQNPSFNFQLFDSNKTLYL